MSGGRWDYLSYKLEERADAEMKTSELYMLMSAIEHELDWGLSGDTCRDCARLRTIAAIEEYFNGGAYSASSAIALVRDEKQNRCPRCEARATHSVIPLTDAPTLTDLYAIAKTVSKMGPWNDYHQLHCVFCRETALVDWDKADRREALKTAEDSIRHSPTCAWVTARNILNLHG